MGEKIKPTFTTGFPMISKGWHLFRVDKADVEKVKPEDQDEEGIKNDKNFTAECKVEGGDDDGLQSNLYFPHIGKKHFGLKRLAGFLIKAGVIAPTDEVDVDTFGKPAFEQTWRMKVPGKMFGGKIDHVPGKKKKEDGTDTMFSNIIEFCTIKELAEKARQGKTLPKAEEKETIPPANNGGDEGLKFM